MHFALHPIQLRYAIQWLGVQRNEWHIIMLMGLQESMAYTGIYSRPSPGVSDTFRLFQMAQVDK